MAELQAYQKLNIIASPDAKGKINTADHIANYNFSDAYGVHMIGTAPRHRTSQ
jgi:hypothetical protein